MLRSICKQSRESGIIVSILNYELWTTLFVKKIFTDINVTAVGPTNNGHCGQKKKTVNTRVA